MDYTLVLPGSTGFPCSLQQNMQKDTTTIDFSILYIQNWANMTDMDFFPYKYGIHIMTLILIWTKNDHIWISY